jgi:hypothetical protein
MNGERDHPESKGLPARMALDGRRDEAVRRAMCFGRPILSKGLNLDRVQKLPFAPNAACSTTARADLFWRPVARMEFSGLGDPRKGGRGAHVGLAAT